MSLSLNHAILGGHLCSDPQVKLLGGTRTVATFTLAINRRWKSAEGEVKEDVAFVDIETWGRTAELVGQYLVKGSACCVDGFLKQDRWQDKDGGKHSRLKVLADRVQFVGPRRDGARGEGAAAGAPVPAATAAAAGGGEDQPPF